MLHILNKNDPLVSRFESQIQEHNLHILLPGSHRTLVKIPYLSVKYGCYGSKQLYIVASSH